MMSNWPKLTSLAQKFALQVLLCILCFQGIPKNIFDQRVNDKSTTKTHISHFNRGNLTTK